MLLYNLQINSIGIDTSSHGEGQYKKCKNTKSNEITDGVNAGYENRFLFVR
jgi:hypothetical protein